MQTMAYSSNSLRWQSLSSLPNPLGLAAPLAGVSNNALIVAGGTNFPDAPPWKGGKKVWYDQAFILENAQGSWKSGLKLPQPIAHAVSLSTEEGVLVMGGGNAEEHFKEVFLINWRDNALNLKNLPPLPQPCAFAAGARLGDMIYLAGGITRPGATEALQTFWALDLNHFNKGWQELPPWPGPGRILPVAGVQDGAFYLFSGARLYPGPDGKAKREYLRDAYRYRPGTGWQQLADLPRSAVAAPTPSLPLGRSHLLVLGGDDGSKVDFQPPDKHPGFSREILDYDTQTNTWKIYGTTPAPYVTTTIVPWLGGFVVPGGEVRPAYRTNDIQIVYPVVD
ncbi:hypothetical protein AsFPU1_0695 [Aphanothece sacrum FPU1]|uniref:Galactose oxidase n=2 Tax=Aphanothece sacrum TaxID=1122 RepID=A0A401IDH0_APHSA|nr:hypothetical protein AsFPU1_0695 [Aphanothece sacrum FPU1]